MIDLRTERLIPLRDVPAYLESRGLGERVTVQMVRRWTTRGYGGVRLESLLVAGWKVTSEEAIQRWVGERTRLYQRVESPVFAAASTRTTSRTARGRAIEEDWVQEFLIQRRLLRTELDDLITGLRAGEMR